MGYIDLPPCYYGFLQAKDDLVLLETARYDADNHLSFLFLDPVQVLQIYQAVDVGSLLQAIQRATQEGYYAAGYMGYECGAYFERIGSDPHIRHEYPLAWFGIYRTPVVFNHATGCVEGVSDQDPRWQAEDTGRHLDTPTLGAFAVGDPKLDRSASGYAKRIARVKEYISAGDVYQVNFTGRYHFSFTGSPAAFYQALRRKQPVPYSAYLRAGGQHILCLSPELFFRTRGDQIVTRPMKGTAPRGRTVAEDSEIAAWLRSDEKNRAENVMIVDLLRNDLGRLCQVGSVRVSDLFKVEQHATLFQMTSTIVGTLQEELDYVSLFRSLFPCGSVTGAPKIRSMQLIQDLERAPRGVYTGAIGYFAPTVRRASGRTGNTSATGSIPSTWQPGTATPDAAVFTVAIRTIVLRHGRGEMGVGSGIVYDSVAADEYAECQLKAAFLIEPPTDFALLETILWCRRYQFLGKHLQRMADSAAYFAYPFDREQIIATLRQRATTFVPGQRYKVRLTLDRTGALQCGSHCLEQAPTSGVATVALCGERTDSHDRFLYHKTTQRARYDSAYQRTILAGHADTLFLNEREEVTEGAISNIFVKSGDWWLTPPLHCGLLNGVYRQHVLQTRPNTREAVLHLQDLQDAETIAICNAIRGWRRVALHQAPDELPC